MKLIDSIDDLRDNLATLETYRKSSQVDDVEFYKSLIGQGRCFVISSRSECSRFGPSRFVGYKSNNRNAHVANNGGDGKLTNKVIDEILGTQSKQNQNLNKQYQQFCAALVVTPSKVSKKFWMRPI